MATSQYVCIMKQYKAVYLHGYEPLTHLHGGTGDHGTSVNIALHNYHATQLASLLLDSHTLKKPKHVQTNHKHFCKRLYVCSKVLLTLLLCKYKADSL